MTIRNQLIYHFEVYEREKRGNKTILKIPGIKKYCHFQSSLPSKKNVNDNVMVIEDENNEQNKKNNKKMMMTMMMMTKMLSMLMLTSER